jgi:hypothetical protein
MESAFEVRRFWSAHLDALENHLDRMEKDRLAKRRRPMESPAAAALKTASAPVNWNKWIRQFHRWFSIAFTLGVIVNFVAVALKKYNAGVGLLALLPLAFLLFTGLYLFLLPYLTRWRSGRRAN